MGDIAPSTADVSALFSVLLNLRRKFLAVSRPEIISLASPCAKTASISSVKRVIDDSIIKDFYHLK
jgi:hypothetical protein